jgi:predicted phage tail protein
MMRDIVLHGALARFGGPYRLEVLTPGEAVRALFQLDGFRAALAQGEYRVLAGPREVGVDDLALSLGSAARIEILPVAAGGKQSGVGKIIAGVVLVAAAVITGGAAAAGAAGAAGAGGAGGAAAGGAAAGGAAAGTAGGAVASASWGAMTAFEAFGATVTYGNIAMFGASMVLGGIIQALTPMPAVSDMGQFESADQRPSSLFNGAVNTTEQGGPVTWIFGRARVGSRVISAGLTAEASLRRRHFSSRLRTG